jgi:hypothetical protein
MTQRPDGRGAKNAGVATRPDALLGFFDFSYQHLALGDLLTSQVNLAIMAIEQGLRQVDVIVMVNPSRPSARPQTFITPANYAAHIDNIMPAFACNPLLRSLQLIRDVQTFNFLVSVRHRDRKPMWPDLRTHLRMQQVYPLDHRRINAFHARHGHIPQLVAPRGYEAWARRFHETELSGRPLVVINPRQSSLTESPLVTFRDAPLPVWHELIDAIAGEQPEALVVMVGAEVRPHDRHYPFAQANQVLTWSQETTEELLSLFRELYSDPRSDRAMQRETMTQSTSRNAAACPIEMDGT